MTWHHLLDAFVLDKRAENRMSERSEEAYRHVITRFFTEHHVDAACRSPNRRRRIASEHP